MERFPLKRPGLDGSPSNVPAAQSLLHCTIEGRDEGWKRKSGASLGSAARRGAFCGGAEPSPSSFRNGCQAQRRLPYPEPIP